jgi:hypothetical protein
MTHKQLKALVAHEMKVWRVMWQARCDEKKEQVLKTSYSIDDAVAALGVSVNYVYRLCKEYKINKTYLLINNCKFAYINRAQIDAAYKDHIAQVDKRRKEGGAKTSKRMMGKHRTWNLHKLGQSEELKKTAYYTYCNKCSDFYVKYASGHEHGRCKRYNKGCGYAYRQCAGPTQGELFVYPIRNKNVYEVKE